MTLAQADVEIVKLARLLRTEPEEIGYLRNVDWQDIRDVRDLREQVTVVMFDADARCSSASPPPRAWSRRSSRPSSASAPSGRCCARA